MLDARYYPVAVGVSILTVFLAPLINQQADRLVAASSKIEPRWVSRAFEDYPAWVAHRARESFRGRWWLLVKKRLLQITAEMLLVAGLLGFSPIFLELLLENPWIIQNQPNLWEIAFWAILALVVLIPLTALWRNLGAVAMITGEAVGKSTRLPKTLIEATVKFFAAVGLAMWLAEFVPLDLLPRWSWAVLAGVMIIIVVLFARRLILWHSHWQYSVEGALAASAATDPSLTDQPKWHEAGRDWGLKLTEIRLPENSAAAGKSIAQLAIRTRFNCAIAEINRAGVLLATPSAQEMLFSGDRLLLIGEPAAIENARPEFTTTKLRERFDFEEASLEFVDKVPRPWVGLSLEAAMRQFGHGLLIVGIQRKTERIRNPGPNEILQTDDGLLILGSVPQLISLQSES